MPSRILAYALDASVLNIMPPICLVVHINPQKGVMSIGRVRW